MRVAILSDIHGNLVALEAVLADLATQGAEQVVCLGDLAFSGPQPHECVALIRALGCPTTLGNCDETSARVRQEGWTFNRLRGQSRNGAWVTAIDLWSSVALTAEDAAWLAALPMTITIPLAPGVELLCAHGSPQSFLHRLLPESPEERMAEMIGPVAARALASGHTHIPMLRRLGPLTVVNPGSVGLPLRANASGGMENPADYAEYGILTWEAGALGWEARRVAVDGDAVYAAARASGMPHPDRYRGDWRQP